ncbi:DUF6175 family protein [Phocaeicola sp. HCN-40430]|uniref:DUF6175 family protein n=1 Tax=Phocaeicola sp. HCN-40430 TaxID=3134664 RepID=UPI0030C21BE7
MFSLSAQEIYSNDVSCINNDGNVAKINASGLAEKKKEVYDNALKSIFNALFINGVDGINNGKPFLEKENSYYIDQFFKSRYQLFIRNSTEEGKPEKLSSGLYKGRVTAEVLIDALIKDMVRNRVMENPLENRTMEETQEEIPLPTIMVVPYKRNTNMSYAKILSTDFDLRMAVSAVDNGFKQLHVNTISVETRADMAQRSLDWEANNADSNDRQLLNNSGADVYVIVDIKKDISPSGSRVSLIMSARETSTGRTLASRSGWTNRFKTTELDRLCAYATQDVLSGFLKDISIEFAKKLTKGNTVALRVGLSDSSINTLNDRVGGSNVSIASLIRNWVRKTSQGGRYHIQGSVAESLIFDTIQIPTHDSDGLLLDASTYADNLAFFLEEQGISCEIRIDGNTIYVTID